MKIGKIIIGIMTSAFLINTVPVYNNNIVPAVSLTASAEDEDNYKKGTYQNLEYKKYSDHVVISGYVNQYTTEIVIPDTIDDLPVTAIGVHAFWQFSKLTSITIPESITKINTSAFAGCSGLTDITILGSITYIGRESLDDTPWLKEKQKENPLVIVNNVLINASTCSGDVIIPDDVTVIGSYAFFRCSNLTSVTIPDCVTTIGDAAFEDCSSLTSIKIPDGITTIEGATFRNCSSMTSVTIPDSVTAIKGCAFERCSSLTSIKIPDSVKAIGMDAFYGCSWLTSINIPYGVTTIDYATFSSCSRLKSITLPDGVTTIETSAFGNCSRLTSITIPDSVTTIGMDAFYGCSWLTSITLPDCMTSLGNGAFSKAGLTSVTIPYSVTTIGDGAFYLCPNLTDITILNPECEIIDWDDPASRADVPTICNTYDSKNYIYYFKGTIYGYENSTAQAYAKSKGFKFKSLGAAPEIRKGDINGNGDIDVADLVLLNKHILAESSLTSEQSGRADLIKDGIIDVYDMIGLRKLVAQSNNISG